MKRLKFVSVVLSFALLMGFAMGCSNESKDVDKHSQEVESVEAEIDAHESTEESTEATTDEEETETTAVEETTVASTATSHVNDDVGAQVTYDGSDYDALRVECEAAGYEVMSLEEACMYEELPIRDGLIDSFVADASDEEQLEAVYAFRYDTAEHARALFDYYIDQEAFEVTMIGDIEVAHNETVGAVNDIYFYEELAIVVVVNYISV